MAYEVDQTVLAQLASIGFDFVKAGGLSQKLAQELALREFQICASLPTIAKFDSTTDPSLHYISRLKPVANPNIYAGVPHGHPDGATKDLLTLWVKAENQFRVPIVASALFAERAAGTQNWTEIKGNSLEGARFVDGQHVSENVTWYNTPRLLSMPLPKPAKPSATLHCYPERKKPPVRVFVKDFSGYYNSAEAATIPRTTGGCMLVSTYAWKKKDAFDGPVSLPGAQTFKPVTPETLTGSTYGDLPKDAQTTYRVIRAVCQAECGGFFDTVTAYDSAYISLSLSQWAFGHVGINTYKKKCFAMAPGDLPATPLRGELEAFLAYVRYKYPADFDQAFGRFGIMPEYAWFTPLAATNPPIASSSDRVYRSALQNWFYQDGGNPPIPQTLTPGCQRYNGLRTWQMFYRFEMAMRSFPSLWKASWDMMRMRLRDILQVPIPPSWRLTPEATHPLTIADVFTSEENVAFLLQWHIFSPGSLLHKGRPTDALQFVVQYVPPDKPPSQWGHAEQMGIQLLLTSTKVPGERRGSAPQAGLQGRATTIANFHLPELHPDDKESRLSPFRDSFRLSTDGLEAPPLWINFP